MSDEIKHYGVKGMKWGVQKARQLDSKRIEVAKSAQKKVGAGAKSAVSAIKSASPMAKAVGQTAITAAIIAGTAYAASRGNVSISQINHQSADRIDTYLRSRPEMDLTEVELLANYSRQVRRGDR